MQRGQTKFQGRAAPLSHRSCPIFCTARQRLHLRCTRYRQLGWCNEDCVTLRLFLAAQMVQNEFRGRGGQHAYNTIMLHTQPSIPSSLKFKWAAPEMVEGALYDDKDGALPTPAFTDFIYLEHTLPQPALHTLQERTAVEACLW